MTRWSFSSTGDEVVSTFKDRVQGKTSKSALRITRRIVYLLTECNAFNDSKEARRVTSQPPWTPRSARSHDIVDLSCGIRFRMRMQFSCVEVTSSLRTAEDTAQLRSLRFLKSRWRCATLLGFIHHDAWYLQVSIIQSSHLTSSKA